MTKRGKLRNAVVRTVLLAVISVVIGLSVYSWNARHLVGNKMPMPFGFGMSVVLSGSMEPELRVDDLVFIRESASYQAGDIVVYQADTMLVIHRIVELRGDVVITQGDANDAADDPIRTSDIKGKLIGKIPQAGKVVRWLKTPVGVVLLLALSVLLLELSWRREKEMDSKELEKIKEEIRRLRAEAKAEKGEAPENEGKTQK